MILQHLFSSFPGGTFDFAAAGITAGLAVVYSGSRKALKKKLSPIALIGIAALVGVIVYGV